MRGFFGRGAGTIQLVGQGLAQAEQARGFATLKVKTQQFSSETNDHFLRHFHRLKSVKNNQKITKSMKMVAAAKYAKAERDLKGARAYGVGAKAFFDNIDLVAADQAAPTAETKKHVLVLITSDRGLCGAVHSSVVKEAKRILSDAGDKDIRVVAIGDKSRAGLQRVFDAMPTPRELRDMLLDTLLHRPMEAEYKNAVKWMDGDRLLFEIQYPASFCKLSGDYFGKEVMNRNQLGIILLQCVDHHLLNKSLRSWSQGLLR
ncbi:hypothetical protein B9Z55_016063 [Caenorhabditis nigoni]|uniref:ATP synthase subunit gamma n=1 Tax=Caenorhabditis nigoni TaxID=1611254 RepID=A0A2G5UDK7_9PELO|nr:hypothetical protein B9Z55_016063 [Caenorhabditis nigoni]